MSHVPQPLDLRLDLRFGNIQSVRLAQAIMESVHEIHLDEDPRGQFAHLRQFFEVRCVIGASGAPLLPGVEIDHAAPLTRIGSLERPLIFPHAILDRCRAAWPAARVVRFFFAGQVSKARERTLRTWAKRSGLVVEVPRPSGALAKWVRRHVLRGAPPAITKTGAGDVMFWSSARGRAYPVKAWDEEYFQALTRAQFVLCPSGDFVWTYRFFEAALCGAIPVVEAACPAYDGFHFFTMQQPVSELVASEEMAEHNFRRCRERLTIPREQLDREITRLLQT